MIPNMWDESKQLDVFLTDAEFRECTVQAYAEALRVCVQRIVDEWPYQRQDLEKEVLANPSELPAILRMLDEDPYLNAAAFFQQLLVEVASCVARKGAQNGHSLSAQIDVDGSVAFVAAAPESKSGGMLQAVQELAIGA
jgi:hypothetical protein